MALTICQQVNDFICYPFFCVISFLALSCICVLASSLWIACPPPFGENTQTKYLAHSWVLMPATTLTATSTLTDRKAKKRRNEDEDALHESRKARKPLAEAILSTRNSRNAIDSQSQLREVYPLKHAYTELLVRVDHPITIGTPRYLMSVRTRTNFHSTQADIPSPTTFYPRRTFLLSTA